MPICKNCGVEIENSEFCPLCKSRQDGTKGIEVTRPTPEVQVNKQTHSKLWFFELFSFFAASAAIIVTGIDFAYGTDLTWSRIPLAAIIFGWLFVFLIYHLSRKPYLLVALETVNFLVFLGFLDFSNPRDTWFLSLAMPVILVIGILCLLTILWIRTYELELLPSISVGTLALGIFLICLELIIHRFKHESYFISWSLVAFASILPLGGILVYLHSKLKNNGSQLKKYFHQ
jgi:hypothetical protein